MADNKLRGLSIYVTSIKMTTETAKDQLIELLYIQVVDLSMMSKIELGDDVIAEIKRLKAIIAGTNSADVVNRKIKWDL